jgi:putative transposase
MRLVEQHIIDRKDLRFAVIDSAAFLSKNLYNAANYLIRQAFIFEGKWISYNKLDKLMKQNPDYCALPRKVSQWVLKQVAHDWCAFFEANKAYKLSPDKFTGRPKLPGYKPKHTGRNLLTYTVQAVSKISLRQGFVQPSGLAIAIPTQKKVQQVRIVPRKTHYTVEIIYAKELQPAENLNHKLIASIDIGLDNLATVTSNKPGFVPVVVNGRPLKSINQYYNKRKAELQSRLPVGVSSKRLDRLTDKRNRRIQYEMHLASRRIIEMLMREGVGTLVIGKNDGWKQEIELGKRNNQNFVNIPHARFINMLIYKAELVGIDTVLREEAYTSKCSFLDREPIAKHDAYLGRRLHRGLFISAKGRRIHADVNGSYNILVKEVPCAFDAAGIEGAVVRPVRLVLAKDFPKTKASHKCL